MTEIYQIQEEQDTIIIVNDVDSNPVLIVNESVENAIFIVTERNGVDGLPGTSLVYEEVFGSVYDILIESETHGIPSVRNVTLFHPDGDEVSIAYTVMNNDVMLYSNINLINHTVKIY